MKINPTTLSTLRKHKGWTQQELARHSTVGLKTISNYEDGRGSRAQANEVQRLAKALGVGVDDLANPPEDDIAARMQKRGWRKITFFLDGRSRLSYQLVEKEYGASPRELVDFAPLAFALLAEMSLSERRKRLEDFEGRLNEAQKPGPGHLDDAFALGFGRIDEAIRREKPH